MKLRTCLVCHLTRTVESIVAPRCLRGITVRHSTSKSALEQYEKSLRVLVNKPDKGKQKRSAKTIAAVMSELEESDVELNYVEKLDRVLVRLNAAPPHYTMSKGEKGLIHCAVEASGSIYVGNGINDIAARNAAAQSALEILTQRVRSKTPRAPLPEKDASAWQVLPVDHHPLQPIYSPWTAPLPRLSHGLSRVIGADNTVATHVKDHLNGRAFSPYLRRIVQPDDINWDAIAPFTPASRDETLHSLAVEHKARFKASTSSITGLLGHIYQVVSNFRPVETGCLSDAFKDQPRSFSLTQRKKPVVSVLRPRDGVWGIDSGDADPAVPAAAFGDACSASSGAGADGWEGVEAAQGGAGMEANQILIDLGKTMERMLTMPASDFRRLLVMPADGGQPPELPDELRLSTYNFSQIGGFMLRSQLDCIHRGNKIFDLKTRATHAIRHAGRLGDAKKEPNKRYLDFIHYRIVQQKGLFYSFEREFYDMMRSCFLKYSFQLRIGRMDGAFVTYHNTREIFGFQYLTLDTIDAATFGSPHMASVYFDTAVKLLDIVLQRVVARLGSDRPIRLTIQPLPQSKARPVLLVQAQPVVGENRIPPPPGLGNKEDVRNELRVGDTTAWFLWVTTKVNGNEVSQPWMLSPEDRLEVRFELEERTPAGRRIVASVPLPPPATSCPPPSAAAAASAE